MQLDFTSVVGNATIRKDSKRRENNTQHWHYLNIKKENAETGVDVCTPETRPVTF